MDRILGIKLKHFAIGVFSVTVLAACSLGDTDTLGNYKKETITVDSLDYKSKPLTKEQYSIDSVCSLEWPQNIQYYSISNFIVKNKRAYVQINSYNNSVFVFDANGKFLWKKGDYNNLETADEFETFFVDNNNNLHTFCYREQRIDVFDSDGKSLRKINTRYEHPLSIGVTGNGQYLYSFMENTCGAALAICDNNGNIQKKLIPFGKKYSYRPYQGFFFQNGNRLSHIPLLSDSILVFNSDTLEKVVKVDFKGRFILDVIPDVITSAVEDDTTIKLGQFNGVNSFSEYQETEDFIFYDFSCSRLHDFYAGRRLIRKKTNETLSLWSLFEGFNPFSGLFLLDDKLVFFVSEETVEAIRSRPRDEKFMEEYNKSAPQVQALIDGKIKTPAIFYISLK